MASWLHELIPWLSAQVRVANRAISVLDVLHEMPSDAAVADYCEAFIRLCYERQVS